MHAIIAGEIADFLMAQSTKESSVVIPGSRTSVAVRVGETSSDCTLHIGRVQTMHGRSWEVETRAWRV